LAPVFERSSLLVIHVQGLRAAGSVEVGAIACVSPLFCRWRGAFRHLEVNMKALMFIMKEFLPALALLVSLSPAAFARCNAYDEVYLFERPRCAPCMAVKRLLAEHGIRYESRDAKDPQNAWYRQTYAGTSGTPVITVGNRRDGYRHVAGYNVPLLRAYLCLQR
jgi:glutaredoxin